MAIAVDESNEFQPQAAKNTDHSWASGSSRTSVTSTGSSESHFSAPLSPDHDVKCDAKQTSKRALLNLELRRLQSFRTRTGVSRREAACIARALTNAASLSTSSTIRDLSFYDAVLDLATGMQTRPRSEASQEICLKKMSAEDGNEMSLTEMIRSLAYNSTAIAERQNDEIFCLRLVVKGLVSELLNIGRSPSHCCGEVSRYPNLIEIPESSDDEVKIECNPPETGQSVKPSVNCRLSCTKREKQDCEGKLQLHESLVEGDALDGSKMQEQKFTQQSADTVVDNSQSVPSSLQQMRTLTTPDSLQIQNDASILSSAADRQDNNNKLSEQGATRAQPFQPAHPSPPSPTHNKMTRSPLDYLYEITADDDSDNSVDALDRVESGILDPKMIATRGSTFGDTAASAESVVPSESLRVEKDYVATRDANLGAQQRLMDTRQEEAPHQALIFENLPPSSDSFPENQGPYRKTLPCAEETDQSYTRDERRLLFDGSLEADESTFGSFETAASEASSAAYSSSRLLHDEFKMDYLAATKQTARHFSKPIVNKGPANPKTDLNELEGANASPVEERAAIADVSVEQQGSHSDSTGYESAEQGDMVEDHYFSRKEDYNVYTIVQEVKGAEGKDEVPANLVSFELLAPYENLAHRSPSIWADGCEELLSLSACSKTILPVNRFERNMPNENLEIASPREWLQETLRDVEGLQQDVSTETTMPASDSAEQALTPFDRVMLFFEETQRFSRRSRKSPSSQDRTLSSMTEGAKEPLANGNVGILDAPTASDPQPMFTAIDGMDCSVNLQGIRRPDTRSSEEASIAKSIGATRPSPSIPSQEKRKEFVRFNLSPNDAGSGTYALEPDSNLRVLDSSVVHSDSVPVRDGKGRASESSKAVEADDDIGTNPIKMINAFFVHRQHGHQRLAGKSQADAGDSPPSTPTRPTTRRRLVQFQDRQKDSGVPDRHLVETSLVLREGEEDIWTGRTVKRLKPRLIASLGFTTKMKPTEQDQHNQEHIQELDGKAQLAIVAGHMDMSPKEGASPASEKRHVSPEIRALIELSSRLYPGSLEQYI